MSRRTRRKLGGLSAITLAALLEAGPALALSDTNPTDRSPTKVDLQAVVFAAPVHLIQIFTDGHGGPSADDAFSLGTGIDALMRPSRRFIAGIGGRYTWALHRTSSEQGCTLAHTMFVPLLAGLSIPFLQPHSDLSFILGFGPQMAWYPGFARYTTDGTSMLRAFGWGAELTAAYSHPIAHDLEVVVGGGVRAGWLRISNGGTIYHQGAGGPDASLPLFTGIRGHW